MIPYSNILNNKRSISSFSVQILSIFTFSRRNKASFSHNPILLPEKITKLIYNPCWSKEKNKDFSSFEKQKGYDLALIKTTF